MCVCVCACKDLHMDDSSVNTKLQRFYSFPGTGDVAEGQSVCLDHVYSWVRPQHQKERRRTEVYLE